jgi:transposase-like protein
MNLRKQVTSEQQLPPKKVKDKSPFHIDSRKTIAMLNLELATGRTIEELVGLPYSLRELGTLLGVHHTTIIHWRRKFLNGA